MKYFLMLGLVSLIFAQDEPEVFWHQHILVTGKSEQTPFQSPQTTYVITAEEIKANQWRDLGQVLDTLPGFAQAQTGGDGSVNRVFLRGSSSEQVMFMVDGVKVNDASDVGRGFDLTRLSTAGVKRIEIVMGLQTGAYGSESSAGVVNLITDGTPTKVVDLEIGSDDAKRGRLAWGVAHESLTFQVEGEHFETESISAASDEQSPELESDPYEHQHLGVSLKIEPSEQHHLNIKGHINHHDQNLDAFGGDFGDDPNYVGETKLNTLKASHQFRSDVFHSSMNLNWSETKRDYENPSNFNPHEVSENHYKGSFRELEWIGHYRVNKNVNLNGGVEWELEKATGSDLYYFSGQPSTSGFDAEAETQSMFAQISGSWDRGGAQGVIRYNDHETFGNETTYQISGQFRPHANHSISASFGTGFRAPSLYQIFSVYGNLELVAETSQNAEISYRGVFGPGFYITGSVFHNDFDEMVDFYFDPETFASYYINVAEAKTRGVDFSVGQTRAKYSWRVWLEGLDTEDSEGETLLRRPDQRHGLSLNYTAEKWAVGLNFTYTGERDDQGFDSVTFQSFRATLGDYHLLQVHGSYEINANIKFFGRVQNALDEDYLHVIGYQAHGARIFGGASFTF